MSTRKPKPSPLSTLEPLHERLRLMTITVKPKSVQVRPNVWTEQAVQQPLPVSGKKRLH